MKNNKNLISWAIIVFVTLFISAYYLGKNAAVNERETAELMK